MVEDDMAKIALCQEDVTIGRILMAIRADVRNMMAGQRGQLRLESGDAASYVSI